MAFVGWTFKRNEGEQGRNSLNFHINIAIASLKMCFVKFLFATTFLFFVCVTAVINDIYGITAIYTSGSERLLLPIHNVVLHHGNYMTPSIHHSTTSSLSSARLSSSLHCYICHQYSLIHVFFGFLKVQCLKLFFAAFKITIKFSTSTSSSSSSLSFSSS